MANLVVSNGGEFEFLDLMFFNTLNRTPYTIIGLYNNNVDLSTDATQKSDLASVPAFLGSPLVLNHLLPSDWTIASNGVATAPQISFLFSAPFTVNGFFIETIESKLLWVQPFDAPLAVLAGETVRITPRIEFN